MLFQTISFVLFCLATFAVYWRFPRARLWVLGLANALFYLAAGWGNLLLFLGASLATYALGRHVQGPRGRWALAAGVALNLLNLGFFKYAGFVTGTLEPILPWLSPRLVQDVLLPIGISFYTFQHISYLVDRRLKGLAAAPNYLQFWVYISFFGHSIAGPIMRGHEFLPQIAETTGKKLNLAELQLGLGLFVLGLIKKVAIADRLAPQADVYFAHAGNLTFGEAWAAALLFTFQIYYDFSAYSDMAVGIGHMFGYKLNMNFKTPYLAANGSEFWSRWHITLSSWIRDYIYIPLGGNRAGAFRRDLNLMLAMLASGLWHGANWTFIFWGAAHGLLLLGARWLAPVKARLGWAFFGSRGYRMVAIAGFFGLVVFTWVLFRAPSLSEAFLIMRAMLDLSDVGTLWAVKGLLLLAAGLYGLHVVEYLTRERAAMLGGWWRRVPAPLQGLAYASLVLFLVLSYQGSQDFIYFRF